MMEQDIKDQPRLTWYKSLYLCLPQLLFINIKISHTNSTLFLSPPPSHGQTADRPTSPSPSTNMPSKMILAALILAIGNLQIAAGQICRAQGYQNTQCDDDEYMGEIASLNEAGTSGCGRCLNPDGCQSINVQYNEGFTYSCNVYTFTDTACLQNEVTADETSLDGSGGGCVNPGTFFSYNVECSSTNE